MNRKLSYSFSDLWNKRTSVDVVVINAVKKYKNKQTYYFLYVNDLSDYLTAGLMKIQHLFQTTLTNGLSHERLTPLNGIILNTDLVLQRCKAQNEYLQQQNSNFNANDSAGR